MSWISTCAAVAMRCQGRSVGSALTPSRRASAETDKSTKISITGGAPPVIGEIDLGLDLLDAALEQTLAKLPRVRALPHQWDIATDVVVAGFGAARFAASVTAHDLGAKVLILEKAPEGQHGGNTRVAGQGYLNTSSADKAAAYLRALCGPYTVPEPMVQVWAEEMCRNNEWLASLGGDPQEHQHQPVGIEFPDLPGSGCVHKFHDGPTYGYSYTWKLFERLVKERPIPILYETPARQLIQHDVTKEILGVRAERGENRSASRRGGRWC